MIFRLSYCKKSVTLDQNLAEDGIESIFTQKVQKKLKTMAGLVVRELFQKLPKVVLQNYESELLLYQRVLNQKGVDKNKIYSQLIF